MKKLLYLTCAALFCLLTGCSDKFADFVVYGVNEPVFMDFNTFRQSVKVTNIPQDIQKQGKICFYEGYLYISEPMKGIHIIDNRNPSSPRNVGFIELPGNADLAIRNNMLYADALVDLVWFDIANPEKPMLKSRLENVFQQVLPPVDNEFSPDYALCNSVVAKSKGIIVGWKPATRTEKVSRYTDDLPLNDMNMGSNSGLSSGINGSMSRFCLYKDYLYVVNNSTMSIFNLSGSEPVKATEDQYAPWNPETMFNYKDCMFMGTPTGMAIYSVDNPLKPELQSMIAHVFGCDPVVVDNDIAYVTVHSGNMCGQNINELMIIDVKDVKKPKPIVSYAMKNPKGLGIDQGTLFLCDDGLQIFRLGEPQKLMSARLAHYPGVDGYDVIPYNKVAMMICDDGLYQYDYSDPDHIKQLSKLNISK